MVLDNHIHNMLMAYQNTTLHAMGWSCGHVVLVQQAMLAIAPR
jgi:hypothetical protein